MRNLESVNTQRDVGTYLACINVLCATGNRGDHLGRSWSGGVQADDRGEHPGRQFLRLLQQRGTCKLITPATTQLRVANHGSRCAFPDF